MDNELHYENIQDIYELAPLQLGMYYHYLRDKSTNTYITQMSYRIKGKLSIDLAEKSLNQLIKQFDILRTVFNHEKTDRILQIVLRERKTRINITNICNIDDKEYYIEQYKIDDRNTVFDLNKDILVRVSILVMDNNEAEFIWTHHHIIMDGWCISKLVNEFNEIYAHYIKNHNPMIKKYTQYKEYIKWLSNQDHNRAKMFWKDYLNNYNEMVQIPWERPDNNNKQKYIKKEAVFKLDDDTNNKLNHLVRKAGVTMNSIIQCTWGVFLALSNRKTDALFGMVVSGRNPEILDVENIIGLFINTLPIRIKFDSNTVFIDLLHMVNEKIASIVEYSYISISEIQALTDLKRNLIDHIVVFENYPIEDKTEVIFSEISSDEVYKVINTDASEQTNYDFNLIVQPGSLLTFNIIYNENVYSQFAVKNIMNHFENILGKFLNCHNIRIGEVDLLTEEDKYNELDQFVDTSAVILDNIPIINRFEMQVLKTPNATALVSGEKTLTYNEFNKLTNKVANILIKNGIRKNDIIALLSYRSIEMMVYIYAIQKIGAIYMPIVPEYPVERIKFMIKDSKAAALLCMEDCLDVANRLNIRTFVYEDLIINNESGDNVKHDIMLSDIMYIIYTSGSSGNPKGVMIEHGAVTNRLNWMQKKYPIDVEDRIVQKTPITFDVSIWELFWWSFTGASLFMLLPGEERNPQAILDIICKYEITIMHFVPSMCQAFMHYIENIGNFQGIKLKRIFTSGEELTVQQVRQFNSVFKSYDVELSNLYGPTEATVDVTYYDCKKNEDIDLVPIGKPIDNIKIYIVGNNNKLMPLGLIGELYISGIGVARGYINSSELTEEKFIKDFYCNERKMYKTGDLARWLPDGNIEYLGRIDNQVKIHGFRIELNEIEKNLCEIEAIDNAIAITRKINNDKELVAFIVINSEIDNKSIKHKLSINLPEYMIPNIIIRVTDIPLTSNGKMNRSYFEVYDLNNFLGSSNAPLEDIELEIAVIWSEVLGIPVKGINIDTNIFEIGGNSINIIYVISKIKKKLDIEISIADIFRYSTIRLLVEFIKEKDNSINIADNTIDESQQLLEKSFSYFVGDESAYE